MNALIGSLLPTLIALYDDAEIKEKRDLVEDGLMAARAASEMGIVPGGGTMLVRAADALADFTTGNADQDVGVHILRQALQVPFQEIIRNGGGSSEVILNAVRSNDNPNYGYDSSADRYCDMLEMGIVDPAKVLIGEIEHACSMAGLILSTDCVIGIETEIVRPQT